MSGQIIGQIAGAVIGSAFGPIGTAIGATIGGAVGSTFDTLPTQYGPRLEDLRPQSSEFGKPIPIVYGTVGLGGNVIWASDYVEVENKTETGGKGGPSQTSVSYSYFGNFAILLADGVNTVGRMWAGPSKRLIYDGVMVEGGTVRIYNGWEDQLPDPLIESYEGVGNVPAFRGCTVVVFEMFPLENDGNTIPFITAEVGATASAHGQTPAPIGDTAFVNSFESHDAAIEPTTGWLWTVARGDLGTNPVKVTVLNTKNGGIVAEIDVPKPAPYVGTVSNIVAGNGVMVLMVAPYYRAGKYGTLKPWIYTFDPGVAASDGAVITAPSYIDAAAYGGRENRSLYRAEPLGPPTFLTAENVVPTLAGGGDPVDPYFDVVNAPEGPIYPACIGFAGAKLWIVYNFNSASVTFVRLYDIGRPWEAESIDGDALIGMPFQVVGDDTYVAIVGTFGQHGNIMICHAGSKTVLHVLSVSVAGSGKALDYDPIRKVFIGFKPNSMEWYSIDAESGEVTTNTLTIPAGSDTSPPPSQVARAITYASKQDRYLIGSTSQNEGSGTTIYIVDPDSGVTQGAYTFETGAQMVNPLLDPVDSSGVPYVVSFDTDSAKRLFLGGVPEAHPLGLGAIVTDLSLRAGLTEDQIDVTALTDMVDGYAVARQTTVRGAIDALRPAYYFDAVESGGKVKFVKRGGQSVAVIEDDDLDAHQADGQPGDPLLTTRQMEVELPNAMNVNYLLAATDYEKATKLARRLVGASGEESTLDLPLVLTDTKAQEIAEVNLHAPWVQRLKYGPFTLPRKYSHLEPTDIITIKGYEMMLEKVTASPGGVLTCEAVATDSSHYTPHVVVTETVPNEKVVYVPGETTLELM